MCCRNAAENTVVIPNPRTGLLWPSKKQSDVKCRRYVKAQPQPQDVTSVNTFHCQAIARETVATGGGSLIEGMETTFSAT